MDFTLPIANAQSIRHAVEQEQAVLIDWLLKEIERGSMTLRDLSFASGLHKTRLGYILHRDPVKRRVAQNPEILLVLKAMDLNPIEASVMIEASRYADESFNTLFGLLAHLYVALPRKIMNAIKEIHGLDGSLIRREWAEALATGIANRLKDVLMQCHMRRDAFMDF
ncbi:hypothetical protein [Sphingobium sp. CFD-2]|uniref:hypothetical protein n=1 Tax=Sphingobium sp. CFD-2 TaxID=2878542 RepID=UPI00214B16EC|nr:hypothetical protein [Sphingobium sp. CFD-2]